jgi:hypothetical protein
MQYEIRYFDQTSNRKRLTYMYINSIKNSKITSLDVYLKKNFSL